MEDNILTYLEGEHGRKTSQQQSGSQKIVQRNKCQLRIIYQEKNLSKMKALSVNFR